MMVLLDWVAKRRAKDEHVNMHYSGELEKDH